MSCALVAFPNTKKQNFDSLETTSSDNSKVESYYQALVSHQRGQSLYSFMKTAHVYELDNYLIVMKRISSEPGTQQIQGISKPKVKASAKMYGEIALRNINHAISKLILSLQNSGLENDEPTDTELAERQKIVKNGGADFVRSALEIDGIPFSDNSADRSIASKEQVLSTASNIHTALIKKGDFYSQVLQLAGFKVTNTFQDANFESLINSVFK